MFLNVYETYLAGSLIPAMTARGGPMHISMIGLYRSASDCHWIMLWMGLPAKWVPYTFGKITLYIYSIIYLFSDITSAYKYEIVNGNE